MLSDWRFLHVFPALMLVPAASEAVVTSSASGGTLTIAINADTATVSVSGGNAKVNGADPSSGAFAAASLQRIAATGTGANVTLDLSALTTANFPNLGTGAASTYTGTGPDRIVGPDAGGVLYTLSTGLSGSVPTGPGTLTWSGVNKVDGSGAGPNTLTAGASTNTWTITGPGSGTAAVPSTVNFSNMQNLTGGASTDNFTVQSAGSVAGVVDGGAGANLLAIYGSPALSDHVTINLPAGTASRIGSFSNMTSFNGGPSLTGLFIGPLAASSWTIGPGTYGSSVGGYTIGNFRNVQAGPGNDTFTMSNDAGAIAFNGVDGGGGADTFIGQNASRNWNINGAGAGVVSSCNFLNFENLTGGTSDDSFNMLNDGSIPGQLNGGAGSNLLSYSSYTAAPVVWTLAPQSINAVSSFVNIQRMAGNTGTSAIHGPDIATAWSVTGSFDGTVAGYAFFDFPFLLGGSADDVFTFTSVPAFVSSANGGGGNDTLAGPNVADTFNVTGADSGNFFTGIENLKGGAGNDTFTFTAAGSISGTVDGGGGADAYAFTLGNGAGAPATTLIADSGVDSTTDTLTVTLSTAGAVDATSESVAFSNLTVGLDSAIELLALNGSSGSDAFNVTPAPATWISADGLLPSTPPGDTLYVDRLGQPYSASSDRVTVAGRQPVLYANFETADVPVTLSRLSIE